MAEATREYCDVVMKGGITSGIVYPNAVLALSERFTFKNIGGTSAGAIAAAATAAAALGARRLDLGNPNGDQDTVADPSGDERHRLPGGGEDVRCAASPRPNG